MFYNNSMERQEEIRQLRLKKIDVMHAQNLEAYPGAVALRTSIKDVLTRFAALVRSKSPVRLSGRATSTRGHGGILFLDVEDESGIMQVIVRKDALGDAAFTQLEELLDVGDFVLANGRVTKTKRGEKSLDAMHVKIIAKALLPPPAKYSGLKDAEERFRKRYLDLTLNKEVRARFVKRAKLVSSLRNFLEKNGFLEVETPMLQLLPGGASARPFSTHLNALDLDLYLRVAPELFLKRLLVGGFEKVYELGRAFRNEGMDTTHNPEFTILEFYWAYQDAKGLMAFTEKMFLEIARTLLGRSARTFSFHGKAVTLETSFPTITFHKMLKRYANIDVVTARDAEVLHAAEECGVESKVHPTRAEQLDAIFKKRCLENLWNPTFVIEHPIELSPLAKAKFDDPSVAERFQLVVAGMEVVNAFSELNDPKEQRRRFEAQEQARTAGSQEAQRLDEEYIEALEYGMPPAAGFGMGIDRLVMLLTDAPSLREVILFPTMRPKDRG